MRQTLESYVQDSHDRRPLADMGRVASGSLTSGVAQRDPPLHGSGLAGRKQRVLVLARVKLWIAGVKRKAACMEKSQDLLADAEREPRKTRSERRATQPSPSRADTRSSCRPEVARRIDCPPLDTSRPSLLRR